MSTRFVGQADTVRSNATSSGAVSGEQIGNIVPGVLESLQESASATQITSLYYDAAYGSFNFPSFQKLFGRYNTRVHECSRWGESGTIWINNDIFWDGPAMMKLTFPIQQRFIGNIQNTFGLANQLSYPQAFYSHGAMFAAVKSFRMNLGGAGTYNLDRNANWVGTMASCFSVMQRYSLMKLAGGGCIAETPNLEAAFGLYGSTASCSRHPRVGYNGATNIPFESPFQRLPKNDHWIIPIKTPHTSFQNPRIRRRPLDTKLFSEHFAIDFWMGHFGEVCDSGTGCPVYTLENSADANLEGADYIFNRVDQASQGYNRSRNIFFENYRQYEAIQGDPGTVTIENADALAKFDTGQNTYAQYMLGEKPKVADSLIPESVLSTNNVPALLDEGNLPQFGIDSVIASLRLTNDMLGAYDVLKTRTDAAIYYPFQHFTTQVYAVPNTQWGGSVADFLVGSVPGMSITQDETMDSSAKNSFACNIVCNPLSALYVCIFREKDRAIQQISKRGGYSPMLFWNALKCTTLELAYGSEPITKYSSHSEYMMEQTYQHCSAFQVPYKGGFCTRKERFVAEGMTEGPPDLIGMKYNASNALNGQYNGIMRNAFIYELSLVEMEPLRNEAIFQQTPSFLGEQLTINFRVDPYTYAFGSDKYDPSKDKSYLSQYPTGLTKGAPYEAEYAALYRSSTDNLGTLNDESLVGTAAGKAFFYPQDRIGGQNPITHAWAYNNDEYFQVVCVYAQNALWQLNPNASKLVFARG
jgi:hypothetical protein